MDLIATEQHIRSQSAASQRLPSQTVGVSPKKKHIEDEKNTLKNYIVSVEMSDVVFF
jgi:hypothetical protein